VPGNLRLKMLLTIVLLLLLSGLGLAYYTGYAGERALRQQFALNQEQAQRQGYQLELQSYERGWLNSRARWRLEPMANRQGVRLEGLLRLDHGPVIASQGHWQLGLFALKAELSSADPETQNQWFWPLTEQLDRLQLVGRFGRHYQLQWRLPQLTLNHQNRILRLESAQLNWQGRYDRLAGQGQMQWTKLTLEKQAGPGLELSSGQLDISLAYRPDWHLEAESHLEAERVHWGGGGQLPLVFEALESHWRQSIEQGRIHNHYQLAAQAVKGAPFQVQNLDAELSLRGLPLELLERWERLARDRLASGQPAFDALAWLTLADESLKENLALEGQLQALLGEGQARADWQVNYRGLEEGAQPQTPKDWAALVDAKLRLRLEEATLTSTPLYWLFAEHFDQHWQSTGSERRLELRWRKGQWTLNPD